MRKSIPTARRLPPESRRKAILDAAIRLIGRDGYSNVSAADIAHLAGVTPALVHHYFGPKRNIYVAILDAWQAIMVASLYVDRALPFRSRVESTIASWFEQIARYPAIWLATDSQGEAPGDAEVAGIRDAVRAQAVELLIRNFDDAVDDTPAARWALMGFTGLHDIALRAYFRGEIDRETTIALLVEGLSATFASIIPALSKGGARAIPSRGKRPGKRKAAGAQPRLR
jgi:AcrR family transcriptional regulator